MNTCYAHEQIQGIGTRQAANFQADAHGSRSGCEMHALHEERALPGATRTRTHPYLDPDPYPYVV